MHVDTLTPPFFLVAMPQIDHPTFRRSVVLLLAHSDDGSFGLIVNQPLDLTISSVLEGTGVTWKGPGDALVHFGGPVQPNQGIALFAGSIDLGNEVAPGVRMTNEAAALQALAENPPSRFRLLIGYSGWGPGQLEGELTRNDWLVAPFDAAITFAADAATSWPRALDSIGVRPESLPHWTRSAVSPDN